MRPLYYTEREGGQWKEWPAGLSVTGLLRQGEKQSRRHGKTIQIHGKTVHSFAFDEPFGRSKEVFRRWDCANGWTHT